MTYIIPLLLLVATSLTTSAVYFSDNVFFLVKAFMVTLWIVDIPIVIAMWKDYSSHKKLQEEQSKKEKALEAEKEIREWESLEQEKAVKVLEAPYKEKEIALNFEIKEKEARLEIARKELALEKERINLIKQEAENLERSQIALIKAADSAKYLAQLKIAEKIAYDPSPDWKKPAEMFYKILGEK